jgi:hypothetical protein
MEGRRPEGGLRRVTGQEEDEGGRIRLTMYSQKSEFGKVMIAWKEYGPDPWGTTGISYAAAILFISL